MIVFVGASASGKTELAKILYETYNYKKCITTTTRLMRMNEKQDIDYHFVSKEDFMNMQSKDEFVEVTIYQGNYYGIQKKDIILNGVVIVDPAGANSLIDTIDQDVFIVYVETSAQLRRLRMKLRGDNQDLIENRLILDEQIFHPEILKRINLYIKNEKDSLLDLAVYIHKHYQSYMLKSKEVVKLS